MKHICPNCGSESLGTFSAAAGLKILRPFRKPARCQKCNGYYRTVITHRYLSDSCYFALLSSIAVVGSLTLYVRINGFEFDIWYYLYSLIGIITSFALFYFLGIFTLSSESCNHNYLLLPHDSNATVTLDRRCGSLRKSGLYYLNRASERFPVIITMIEENNGSSVVSVGYINGTSLGASAIADYDRVSLEKNRRTLAEGTLRLYRN